MRFPDNHCISSSGKFSEKDLKVEIHARVGNEKLVVQKEKEMYDVVFDGDMGLKLKMTQVSDGLGKKKIANAQAADAYIGQHDLVKMAEENDRSDNSGLPDDSSSMGLSQDALEKHDMTNFAKDYIEKHKLRQFIQEMFQNIIKEKPEDPYGFMQEVLDKVHPPGPETPEKARGGNFRKGKYAAPAAAGDGQVGLIEQNGQFFFTIGVDSPEGALGATASTTAATEPFSLASGTQDGNALAGKVTLKNKPPAVRDMDVDDLGPPPKDPKYLVDLVDCQDQGSNGTFAWVGEYHDRPLYRLLGPEPRYLYFWDDPKDEKWCGWWIAEQTGANDYIEWFKDKSKTDLPINCGSGEAGGKVQEAFLTLQTVEMISMVSNKYEEMTIRAKLQEGFGKGFVSLEKAFRTRSLNSATAAVAKAFESQQRALEILQEKLQEEQALREAAEKRAREMEEAFRQLQAKVSAFIPS